MEVNYFQILLIYCLILSLTCLKCGTYCGDKKNEKPNIFGSALKGLILLCRLTCVCSHLADKGMLNHKGIRNSRALIIYYVNMYGRYYNYTERCAAFE